MLDQDGRASKRVMANELVDIFPCSAVGLFSLMGSIYQRVSLEKRPVATTPLGYYLLYLVSLLLP